MLRLNSGSSFCLLLLVAAGFCKCVSDLEKPSSTFGFDGVRGNLIDYWNEELPVSGDMKYEIDSIGGFPLDGSTFAVIDYTDAVLENRYNEWFVLKQWGDLGREDSEYIDDELEQLTVPEEYRPDHSGLEVYKRTESDDVLYIMHKKGSNMICVLEVII